MNKILFATLLSATTVMLGTSNALAGIENPETNKASYWGDNCSKTEISGDVKEYTVTDSGITKVIVKGGTGYIVYEDGNFTNLTAPLNQKNGKTYGISHIIECEGGKGGPVDPTNTSEPTDPVPTTPTNPVDPEGETENPSPTTPKETTTVTTDAGKGGPTKLPAELPKTGASTDLAAYFTLATGLSILVALVGYKSALNLMSSRLN